MGGIEQIYEQDMIRLKENDKNVRWVLMEAAGNDDRDDCNSEFVETDSEDFDDSVESSSSSDIVEDASSSSCSSAYSSYGPLYELSELMAQLPIKRGLSKYYQGKSESFASLASVQSLEDLAKKGRCRNNYRNKMKACKSYGGGFDGDQRLSPRAIIAKKPSNSTSRVSLLASLGKRTSFVGSCRSIIPVQKQF